jgi:hypothetical protein
MVSAGIPRWRTVDARCDDGRAVALVDGEGGAVPQRHDLGIEVGHQNPPLWSSLSRSFSRRFSRA